MNTDNTELSTTVHWLARQRRRLVVVCTTWFYLPVSSGEPVYFVTCGCSTHCYKSKIENATKILCRLRMFLAHLERKQLNCGPRLFFSHYIIIVIIMALQLFTGPWPFFSFLILYTVGRTPWTGISLSKGRYLHTEQHTQSKCTQYRYPYLEWDSNPRLQRSSERRHFMPYTARPLWSAFFSHDRDKLTHCFSNFGYFSSRDLR
jgi:hypothetical protein